MNDLLKPTLVEFIGTFVLVFIGAGAVAVTGLNGFEVVVPALAHGLVVTALIYTYGHISGTHINPAVTVGLLVGGHITPIKALAYIVAQCLGAIAATYVLFGLVDGTGDANFGQTVGALTTGQLTQAAIIEAFLAFFLVSAIYQTAVFGRGGSFAGVAIGFTLTACILAAGPLTGASVNPARTLGPALRAGEMGYVLPYTIALLIGGAAAGVVQQFLLKPEN